MKNLKLLGGLALLAVVSTASATIVIDSPSGTINLAVPDANPTGVALSQTFSGLDASAINNVAVTLNITGGYNGDLYGYLVLQETGGGTFTSILLNRVGRTDASGLGYSQSGFGTIILSGDASTDIHLVTGNPAGGTYAADGRTLDPNRDFSGTPDRSAGTLDVLNGHNANGTWTLFLADLAGGDQSTLVSWNLNVSVVPEPVTWALGIFAGALGLVAVGRYFRKARLVPVKQDETE